MRPAEAHHDLKKIQRCRRYLKKLVKNSRTCFTWKFI